MKLATDPFREKIEKPWGAEIIYTPRSLEYTGKILLIKAGCQISFQYHEFKQETLCLYSGDAQVWLEDDSGQIQKVPMQLQQGYTILPGQKHRIVAKTDCIVLEASTTERGMTVRVEDDYSRKDETEAMREEENRGWHGAP